MKIRAAAVPLVIALVVTARPAPAEELSLDTRVRVSAPGATRRKLLGRVSGLDDGMLTIALDRDLPNPPATIRIPLSAMGLAASRSEGRIALPQILQTASFTHLSRPVLAADAIVLAAATPSSAQSGQPDILAPERQLHFDVSLVGLNVGVALRQSPRTAVGASLGVGGNWMNYMVLGGPHFAGTRGVSYGEKDGATDKALWEGVRATVFVRRHFDGGRHVDVGLKASGFLHWDSSDDDPGGGTFVGLHVASMWWQWRKLRVGSELDAGRFSEGRPEFGVNLAPLVVRLAFP